MTDAATLNATARVRQLVDLTTRLTARLTEESRIFESHRPQDAAAALAGTQELANAYRRESAQVKASPASIADASLADRTALIRATEAFEAVLSRHARTVEAARIVSEGLVRTIATEVAGQRGNPSAYGASGKAQPGDDRAVAFNRQA
jgi:hypothetical protein